MWKTIRFTKQMRERPMNAVLALLAICMLVDLFLAGTRSDFRLSMGVFGGH